MLENSIDPFLILETADSKRYIQFFNEDPGLLIDLPQIALSETEIERAEDYFEKRGIPLTVKTARNPDTRKAFELLTWSKTFHPSEIDKVTEIAFGALFEIYGISENTPLSFVRGWEQ
jgi:hypothetical protein